MMAQTYAIVEFEKKDCAIVPMTWICGNNCFWPKANKDLKMFQQLVSEYAPPKEEWSQHMIIKIHDTLEGIENAERRLSQIIEESTNSESVNCNTPPPLVRREIMDINSDLHDEIMEKRGCAEFHNSETNKNVNALTNEDYIPPENYNSSASSVDSPLAKKMKTKRAESIKSIVSRGKKEELKAKKKKNICRVSNVWPDSSSTDDEKSFKGYNTPSTIRAIKKHEKTNSGSKHVLSLKTTYVASEDEGSNSSKAESSKNSKAKETNPVIAADPKKSVQVLQNLNVSQNNSPNYSQTKHSRLIDRHTTQSFSSISTSSPSRAATPSVTTYSRNRFETTVIKHLEKLTEVQDQNTIKIDQIWKVLNEKRLKYVSKPEEFPILPVDSKEDFQKLEELLMVEPMNTYLKNRLACIGGLNVRTTVMGMLRFCLTNRLAAKFNWAGQNKRAFKATKLRDVIYEATELCFASKKPSDMNDKAIEQAMKDWLRLATQRRSK